MKSNNNIKTNLLIAFVLLTTLSEELHAENDKLSSCKKLLQGASYNYLLEKDCGFNDEVSKMAFSLYRKSNCDSIISKEYNTKLVKEVLDDTKQRASKLGQHSFCVGNKSAYIEVGKTLHSQNKLEQSSEITAKVSREFEARQIDSCIQQYKTWSNIVGYSRFCKLTNDRSNFINLYEKNMLAECANILTPNVKENIDSQVFVASANKHATFKDGLTDVKANQLWCKAIDETIDKTKSEN